MKKQTVNSVVMVVNNVELDRDETVGRYDDSHRFQAFLKGTWTPGDVRVVEHEYGVLNMLRTNDLVVKVTRRGEGTYFTHGVARMVRELFGETIEARCMQ